MEIWSKVNVSSSVMAEGMVDQQVETIKTTCCYSFGVSRWPYLEMSLLYHGDIQAIFLVNSVYSELLE